MQSDTRWRLVSMLLLVGISAGFIAVSGINLGLDLQGGTHFVLSVEVDKVKENEFERAANDALNVLIGRSIDYDRKEITQENSTVFLKNQEDVQRAFDVIKPQFPHKTVTANPAQKSIVFTVDAAQEAALKEDAINRAIETLRNRIDSLGVSEPIIQRQGLRSDRILLQLPGLKDPEQAKEVIGKTAQLRFQILNSGPFATREAAAQAAAGNPSLEVVPGGREERGVPIEEFYVLNKESPVTGADVEDARIGNDENGLPAVNYTLMSAAGDRMSNFTSRNVGQQMAIILEGKVQLAPSIREPLYRNVQISGSFSMMEAQEIALVLRAGALPAPLTFLEERTVDPSLGADSIEQGAMSMAIGSASLVLFILLYYRLAGLIAVISLTVNLLLVLGGLSMFGAVLTLPGIAGIILTIGMAVDANVLIFERIREELAAERTLRQAIDLGFERASLTIFDANITTLLAGFVLLQFGSGPVKGFAVVLSIGIFTSVFTALVVSRLLFSLFLSDKAKGISMMDLVGQKVFDFLNFRIPAATLSALIIIGGFSALAVQGPNFGIDFAGGTMFQVVFNDNVDTEEIRGMMRELGYPQAMIQGIGATGNEVLIRIGTSAEEQAQVSQGVREALRETFSERFDKVEREEMVGSIVGADLQRSAIMAIVFSLIGLIIYISLRFELSFGIAASIALVHDVLITLSAFWIFYKELTLPVVAALLTIIGYSLNDTIVVFDRVRENFKPMRKEPIRDIINTSISQNLGRTLLTSVTTLLVVLSLFIFGGVVINDFAFALLIGVIVGTYSSIYIATSFLIIWHNKVGIKLAASTSGSSSTGSGERRRRRADRRREGFA